MSTKTLCNSFLQKECSSHDPDMENEKVALHYIKTLSQELEQRPDDSAGSTSETATEVELLV